MKKLVPWALACLLVLSVLTFGADGVLPSRIVWKADGADMALVPGGSFIMGGGKEPNEQPGHLVNVETFFIDRFEVTFARYLEFCDRTDHRKPVAARFSELPESQLQRPVSQVTWSDADAFCKWAGKRLPTEAEWEWACRGAAGLAYPWGNGWNGSACVNRTNSGDSAAAVGSKPQCQSPCGAMDMAGNVWEWTADWYKSYPGARFTFDKTGEEKVARGGAYFYSIDLLRCSARHHLPMDDASDHGGFRCAVSPGPDLDEKAVTVSR